jgi:hypothetical protein
MSIASSSIAARHASEPWAASGRSAGAQPLLVRHLMLDPPLVAWGAPAHGAGGPAAPVGAVWKPACGLAGAADKLVSMRHFALQALQLKVECLAGAPPEPRHAALRLFLDGSADHVYADDRTFRRLAAEVDDGRPRAEAPAVLLDLPRGRVLIDTHRCFDGDSAVLTTAAVQAVVGMLRARAFGAYLQQRPQLLGSAQPTRQLVACGLALQAAACRIVRTALDEPGLGPAPLAQRLADRVGRREVACALLTGALRPTQATVLAFVPLWEEWQREHGGAGGQGAAASAQVPAAPRG